MTQRFTTSSVPPGERLAYWTDMICDVYVQLDCDAAERTGFRGSIRSHLLAQLDLSVVDSVAQRVLRTPRQISRAAEDFFLVSIQTRGRGIVSQDGRDALLQPGDFALYDTTSPYRREFPEGTTLVMLVPQQLLNLPPRAFAQIAALRIPGDRGIGAIASPLLGGVAANLPALLGPGGRAIMQSVVDVIGACVAELLGITAPTRSHTHLELLMQVREYIMGRLGETDLTPQRIAEEHFISVRTLHSLFKEQGTTVATWIRERRLEMARRDLIDPLCTDPIRLIGERWGFVDATHFSNAFRLAYGASPRSYRQAAQAVSQRAGDA